MFQRKHVIWVVAAWALFGFAPVIVAWLLGLQTSEAGVFGDSFGFVNSLFSGSAFLIATTALILEIRGEAEQARMQTRQMELAETTARIQAASLRHEQRTIAQRAFMDVHEAVFRLTRTAANRHHDSIERMPENEIERVNIAFFDAVDRVQGCIMSLTLIFGERADELRNHLDKMCDFATDMTRKKNLNERVSLYELRLALEESVAAAVDLIKTLWVGMDQKP